MCRSCGALRAVAWRHCAFCHAELTPVAITPTPAAAATPVASAATTPPDQQIESAPATADPPTETLLTADIDREADTPGIASVPDAFDVVGFDAEAGPAGSAADGRRRWIVAALVAVMVVLAIGALLARSEDGPGSIALVDPATDDDEEAPDTDGESAAEGSDSNGSDSNGSDSNGSATDGENAAGVGDSGAATGSSDSGAPEGGSDESETSNSGASDGQTDAALPVVERLDPPVVGAALAADVAGLCADEVTGLVGAPPATIGAFNDLVQADQSQGGPFAVDPSQPLLLRTPPSLVRCVSTSDADVVEICDDYTNGFTYTRIATTWSVRLLEAADGSLIAAADGIAQPEPCPDELVSYDDTRDFEGRGTVPDAALDDVVVDHLAPHPSFACRADSIDATVAPGSAPGVDGVHWADEAARVSLPESWAPSADAPLSVGLCVAHEAVETSPGGDGASACETIITVTAKTTDDEFIGAFTETQDGCEWGDWLPVPSESFLRDVVGPAIGH